ncbi:YciI family protein [Breoghania sp. L-A4]|uniref:YciI family protein n=1 Tax=Breoghania sp. L-A4 TaxID=2304600 RepID=UPI000E35EC35|nr:YciI family protein [Breoghania sp. L-A4]AXS41076.1 hypothetical protein D1F64_14890 [Breoghania sp. L-A4]
MSQFVVLFQDNLDRANERPRHMAAHLEFLRRNADRIQAAGPLMRPDDGAGAGGLWLVSAENAETVETLVREDPFWPTGLRKDVTILGWKQVFRDGQRLNS